MNQQKMIIKEYKFLTFHLNNDIYGIEMSRVKEIIGIKEIKTVPEAPYYMKGVISLRKKIMPVVDLRLRFSMPESEHPLETCIIITEVRVNHYEKNNLPVQNRDLPQQIGIIVDRVAEVFDIKSGDIEENPSYERGIDKGSIIGLGKVEENIIMLLDIEEVLSSGVMVEPSTIEELTSGF